MAVRNVGSIGISVEADTGRMRAQIVKAGEQAGKAGGKAIEEGLSDVDGRELIAKLKKIKVQAERALAGVEIDIDVDKGKALSDIRELEAKLRATQLELHVEADFKSVGLEAEIAKLRAKLQQGLNPEAEVGFNWAQLNKDAHQAKAKLESVLSRVEARIDAKVDDSATLRVRELKERIQSELVGIEAQIGVDDSWTKAELKKLQARLRAEHLVLSIDTELDDSVERQLKTLEARLGTFRVNVTGQINRGDFAAIKKQAQALLGDIEANVDLELEIDKALAEVQELNAAIKRSGFLPVDVDLSEARRSLEVFRAVQSRNEVTIPVDIDIDSLDAALARAESRAAAGGSSAGKSFSDSFGDGFNIIPGNLTRWVPLILASIEPLGPAIQGILGGAVQVASSAFSALAGAAGAAAPLVAGLGASLAAVAIGSLGVGKAIKAVTTEFGAAADEGRAFDWQATAITKSLAKLGPAAEGVVRAFAELYPQLQAFQNVIAERLFAGLGDELAKLSQETIPDIAASLGLAADSANRFFRGLSSALQDVDFTGTFIAIQPALDALGRAIANVVGAIEPFLKAAAPAAHALAVALEGAAANFTEMVKAGAGSGAITRFLQEGLNSLEQWARLAFDTGRALFHLFQIGKEGGDSLVESLGRIVAKWDAWMQSAEGQNAIKEFMVVSRALLQDLVPVIQGVAKAFANIFKAGAESSFRELTKNLGEILPVLGDLIGLLSRVNITGTVVRALAIFAGALEDVMPALQDLASELGDSFAGALVALTPLITTFARAIGIVAEILTPLAPVVTGLVLAFAGLKVIQSISGMFTSLGTAVGGIGPAFAQLKGNIAGLGPAAQEAALAMKLAFQAAKAGDIEGFGTGLKMAGQNLVPIAKGVGSAAGVAMAGAIGIAFGAQMAVEGDNIGQRVSGIATIVASSLSAFAAGGPILGGITLALGATMALFQQSEAAAKKAAAEVKEYTQAIQDMGQSADSAKVVATVLENLQDETEKTREAFIKTGFIVGDWAKDVVEGTKSAAEGVADWIESLTGADDPLADLVRTGKVSLRDLEQAFKGTALVTRDTGSEFYGLAQALDEAGISVATANNQFDFLADETEELGKGQKEVARQALEAGHGLDSEADSAKGAGDASSDAASGLMELGDASGDTEKTMAQLQATLLPVIRNMQAVHNPAWEAAAGFREAATAADAAAKASDAMRTSFDRLVSPTLDAGAAADALFANYDALTKAIEENGKTIDQNTEAGRTNREQVRTSVQGILEYAEAQTKIGTSAADVTAVVNEQRDALIEQATAFFGSKEEAEAYINQLGLTPAAISTIITTPGLLDAMGQIIDYDTDLDGLPNTIDTYFNTPTLAQVKEAVAAYGVDLTNVPDDVLTQFIAENLIPARDDVIGYKKDIDKVDGTKAVTTTSTPGLTQARTDTQGLATDQDKVDEKKSTEFTTPGLAAASTDTKGYSAAVDNVKGVVNTAFNTPGLAVAISDVGKLSSAIDALHDKTVRVDVAGAINARQQVDDLKRSIDNLQSKTVTVTTNTKTVASMAGRLVAGPTTTTVGERGYAEAIVPLQLPLNRVDPSVREMAALLRGGATSKDKVQPTKIVNVYLTVTPSSADPAAVAAQVMNRAAALAS